MIHCLDPNPGYPRGIQMCVISRMMCVSVMSGFFFSHATLFRTLGVLSTTSSSAEVNMMCLNPVSLTLQVGMEGCKVHDHFC